ncbi:hypothetical protein [Polaribacter sp. IC073]|uniref:hypothetical protein n=1 Tax=Polaribacter sp. IC073 TaxID=2508540 RepID=UPI0011BF6A25|nr:hypothetical protein [Polaribacter sp. IC073]TXD48224.1 hypothetical protein ES045_07245 [Polaribacter sp. IC073]
MKIIVIPREDLKKISAIFNREAGLFIASIFILFFDGIYFNHEFYHLQKFFNVLMISAFTIMLYRAAPRVKELMVYAVFLGFIGEYLFSKGLNMYTYRLQNIPLYVPFGHAVLFARIFRFSKASIVKKHQEELAKLFQILIAIFATIYLVFFSDVFGFVMTVFVFLLLWKRPKDRLFFYSMYILVAILEIGGTAFGTWKWPGTAFGVIDFLPSNNPPSGISLFYFLLDIGCFFIYTQRHKYTWRRLKNIRRIKTV